MIARRNLPNDAEALLLAALMDRRQGNFEKSIQEFNEAIKLDPHNSFSIVELYRTLGMTRQFREAEKVYQRLIKLIPDQPKLALERASFAVNESGNNDVLRFALATLPTSMKNDRDVLFSRLDLAFHGRDWIQAKELIEKVKGGDDDGQFAYGPAVVPVGCFSVLLARLEGEEVLTSSGFNETREQLNQNAQRSPENAALLSQLAVLDALLNKKQIAISEAKRAAEMFPVSKDAIEGPRILVNLALVYAWTNELDLAFETLSHLTKTPGGIYYGELKLDPYWDPLRKDPRFDKLLAELAPRD
jgi:tetratricopeptide (TPR) repeat protein